MTESEYNEKFKNATTQQECDKLNDEFLKSGRKIRKIKNIKTFCKDNFFNIVNSIVAILALIVAILSLVLQLK